MLVAGRNSETQEKHRNEKDALFGFQGGSKGPKP